MNEDQYWEAQWLIGLLHEIKSRRQHTEQTLDFLMSLKND